MDNMVARSRYPRYSVPGKKKKKSTVDNISIKDKIAMQTLACIFILLTAGIIKNVNTPVTAFLSQKIGYVLAWNMESEKLYETVEGVVSFVKGSLHPKDASAGGRKNTRDLDGLREDAGPSSLDDDETGVLDSTFEAESTVEDSPVQQHDKNSGSTANQSPVPSTPASKTPAQNQTGTPAKTQAQPQSQPQEGKKAASGTGSTTPKSQFIVPAAGVLGSPYGERVDPLTKALKMHKGVDIEANHGDSIKAADDGEVIEAAQERTYGNYIKIRHSGGYTTVYAHCSQLIAKKGQKVKQGDLIARVGNTGASVGAHLHFEIWKDGKALDPASFIRVPLK